MAATDHRARFAELCRAGSDAQLQLFLKSFIFTLGENWTQVVALEKTFHKYIDDLGEGFDDLNPIQAADFLQKNGATRTATERRQELKDVDLDNNDRICFIEYLLLQYKVMILKDYHQRHGSTPSYDLGEEATGVGIVGVGEELLEELFTMPTSLDPELEAAIERFMAQKRERENRMKELGEKAKAGGVKGLTAGNELAQMLAADTTEMNRLELTLEAARRKAAKRGGGGDNEAALAAAKKAKEDEEKLNRANSRAKLAAMSSRFEQA
eukprot:c25298_g1_i1.p2 GENE.c25298_g1_i1~~c25298_g1_i1.p2  ORF type:complete len:268 (+),score=76.44 c25298_g1_i1:46-849(+)